MAEAPEHWLFKSPDNVLEKYNTQNLGKSEATHPYTVLTIRTFIFFKDAVLLMREDGDEDTWTVPMLRCVNGDGDDTNILHRLVTHLSTTANIPYDVLNNIQFTDLSHRDPVSSDNNDPDPSNPREKTVLAILTTSDAALNQDVARKEEFNLPPTTRLRWILPSNINGITHNINLAIDLPMAYVAAAEARRIDSLKPQLLARMTYYTLHEHCSLVAITILATRKILQNGGDLGYGLLSVTWRNNQWRRYLYLAEVGFGEWYRPKATKRDGRSRLLVVGRWNGYKVDGTEGYEFWIEVIDATGRVREGEGWDWV